MFPQGAIRVISVGDQPLLQYAIQHQFQQAAGLELSALGTSLADIEPLIQQHQPHVAILEAPFPHPKETTPSETASLAQVLQRLQFEFPAPKILTLASRLEPTLIPNLEALNIRGYLLKHDPLTLHLPDAVRALALGGFMYSEAVLHAKNVLPEPAANGILTPRQLEILNTVLKDPNSPYAQHAERMSITESTWDTHLCSIYSRLGVNTLTAAILRAVELGLLSLCHLSPKCPQNACAPNQTTNQPNKQTNDPELVP